uniref:DUF834 domain-containing protein n=1 Tax=Oryza rufipogon TaxID=4529 RepID=A0A0E0QXR6_ORYRU
MTEDDRRRAPKGNEVLVDDDNGVPAIFGRGKPADGLHLGAAMPKKATTTSRNHEVDGKALPEAE